MHFGAEDGLNLHAQTNYCLGFIQPLVLILFHDAINVAETKSTWPYSNFVKYGYLCTPFYY
jgi:hypothetical protein